MNLVTSCRECNVGKSAKIIHEVTPSPPDVSKALQSLRTQILETIKKRVEIEARDERKQKTLEYWCRQTGRDSVDPKTIKVIFRYVETYGEGVVFPWIKIAAEKGLRYDDQIGRYISGIRRKNEEQFEAVMAGKREARLKAQQKAEQEAEFQTEYGPNYDTHPDDGCNPRHDEDDIQRNDTLKHAKYFIDMFLLDLRKRQGIVIDGYIHDQN